MWQMGNWQLYDYISNWSNFEMSCEEIKVKNQALLKNG